MNWFYVEAGQQAGPVDDARLAELVRSGKIQSETLVWREGMVNWQAYREVAPAAPLGMAGAPPVVEAPPVATAGGVICSECGRTFPTTEVIRYGERWICAGCKPVFFQRLSEGAPLGTAGMAHFVSAEDILARDYEVDVGESLNQGWTTFKAGMGVMIGVSVLVYITMMAASFALGLIPIPLLNSLLTLLVSAPLMGGLWVFYIKRVRGEDAGVQEGFSGFGPRYWQLVLTNLIPMLIVVGTFIIIGLFLAATVGVGMASRGGPRLSGPNPAMLLPVGIVGVVAVIAMVYLSTCWMFAVPLAADKGLKFWPALELSRKVVKKHWWMTFWLLFVAGILAMVGVLACGVGLLFTAPAGFAMIVSHYQKVFGDLSPNQP
jgi:hypothetical protein